MVESFFQVFVPPHVSPIESSGTGLYWVVLGCTGFYRVLPSFTEFFSCAGVPGHGGRVHVGRVPRRRDDGGRQLAFAGRQRARRRRSAVARRHPHQVNPFYRVSHKLISIELFFTEFYWVLLGFTMFKQIILFIIRLNLVFIGLYWVLLGVRRFSIKFAVFLCLFSGFYSIFLCSTGFILGCLGLS